MRDVRRVPLSVRASRFGSKLVGSGAAGVSGSAQTADKAAQSRVVGCGEQAHGPGSASGSHRAGC